jgi:acyl-CoA synthetase (NDP forming)
MNQHDPPATRSEKLDALDEHQAKNLLSEYDIPVVTEIKVGSAAEAVSAAERLGFPVVLKALGRRLLHKSERHLVHLALGSAAAVQQAAAAITAEAGADLEGLLVQPHLSGRRELVAGLFRDPQFGPVVMVGLGGILTEALSDVAFRLAPLTEHDVSAMLAELRASRVLGPFRGEPAVADGDTRRVLLGLSRLALQRPEVAEVDINPLVVGPDGRLTAVDALVVLAPPATPPPARPPVAPAAIGALFHPRSIAFIGASARIGKWGNLLCMHTLSGGYAGQVYLVNARGGQIAGRQVYRSVQEIPGPVDLAVVTVPAARVPALIPELAAKGIGYMVLVSSGFAETGTAGQALEQELVRQARQAGILILGPNTMGICNPHLRLYCTGSPVTPEPGGTAMVAQSGNMGTQLLAFAEAQGVGIRGFSGSGNEAMITIEDYLEGFEHDRLTRTVILYVESVKDGRRFIECARRVGRRKPVVLLKGGRSAAGHRAAASHTGAMASDSRVFEAACRQTGIVTVQRPMGLLDLAAAFSSLPLPRGPRTAIMTLGGGWGVVTADLCAEFGLEVPPLPPELVAQIDPLLPDYWSRSNPVDIVGENDPRIPMTVMEALLAWQGCDAVIHLGILGRRIFAARMTEAIAAANPQADAAELTLARQFMTDFEQRYVEHLTMLMARYDKPVFGVSLLTDASDRTVHSAGQGPYRAVFFPTPERAVQACAHMLAYTRFLEREGLGRDSR